MSLTVTIVVLMLVSPFILKKVYFLSSTISSVITVYACNKVLADILRIYQELCEDWC